VTILRGVEVDRPALRRVQGLGFAQACRWVILGLITLYGVPLTVVAFGSLVLGMMIMLVAGIRSDLKVRRILRARLMEEDLAERSMFVDRDQQDLFGEGEEPS